MPSRYLSGAANAAIPLAVLQSIASDPKAFQETIKQYAKAKRESEKAGAAALAKTRALEVEKDLFEKHKARSEADLKAEQDKVAREWVRLEAGIQESIKEKRRLSEIDGALDARKAELDRAAAEQKTEARRLETVAGDLDLRRQDLDAFDARTKAAADALKAREQTFAEQVADLNARIGNFKA